MNYKQDTTNINSEFGVAAALEARRLSEKYGKDYLNVSGKQVAVIKLAN